MLPLLAEGEFGLGGYTSALTFIVAFGATKAATNYGRLYAGMVIVIVPVLIFYLLVQKKLLETSNEGGLK